MLLEVTTPEASQAAEISSKPRTRNVLTDANLKALKAAHQPYKVTDGDGMYVLVSTTGAKSFRLDYRLAGRRETLTIGHYEADAPTRTPAELAVLDYGLTVSLKDARALRDRASRQVEAGESPSKAKVLKRTVEADAPTFGTWAAKYFEFKADPKSGDERLADSTLALRKSVYRRVLEVPLGKLRLEDIKAHKLAELLDKAKAERGPGPAVHARELVLLVYRFAIGKGLEVTNPAELIQRRTIATFKARERNLDRHEIKQFFDALQSTPTLPTLRLALRFMLLTMVRKSEFIDATWSEIDWDRSTWTIPAARMKAGREHVVPLSDQALDILTTFQTCFSSSKFLHPGRYDSDIPISNATLNRSIDATVSFDDDLPMPRSRSSAMEEYDPMELLQSEQQRGRY